MLRTPRRSFRVSIMQAAVLLHNVGICLDADCDADMTVAELVHELDKTDAYRGYIARPVLESALFCCNVNDEDDEFWHPTGRTFNQFLYDVLPTDVEFDRFYNFLREKPADGP